MLNIGRLNNYTASVAERIASDINRLYRVMPGRFNLANYLFNNPLLRWIGSMDDRYFRWMNMVLPSLGTNSLLTQLLGRLRIEKSLAPFRFAWFNRDWQQYIKLHNGYLPETDLPENRVPWDLIEKSFSPTESILPLSAESLTLDPAKRSFISLVEDASVFSEHEFADSSLPYISPAILFTKALIRHLESNRSSMPLQTGHTVASISEMYTRLPLSENQYQRIFSSGMAVEKEQALPPDVEIITGSKTSYSANIFVPALSPSISQTIASKYVFVLPGSIPKQDMINVNIKLSQQPAAAGGQEATVALPGMLYQSQLPRLNNGGLDLPYIATQQPEGKQNFVNKPVISSKGHLSEKALDALEQPGDMVIDKRGNEAKSGQQGMAGWRNDYPPSDFINTPNLLLPFAKQGSDFDSNIDYSFSSVRLITSIATDTAVMPPDTVSSGVPVSPLTYAPVPFIQKSPTAPGERQDTREQSSDRIEDAERAEPEQDMETLAQEIYEILRRRMLIEQERLQGVIT